MAEPQDGQIELPGGALGKAVWREVQGLAATESRRAKAAGVSARSMLMSPDGDGVRVVIPSGYDDVIARWWGRFGDSLTVEVRDFHAAPS